jgi:hypothetical protein
MNRIGSKLRYRLLLYGFLLGVLPVVTLGIITYHIASSTIQDKINEANQLLLDQTVFLRPINSQREFTRVTLS